MTPSNKSLSERLLRYSAVASLTASAGLLVSPANTFAETNAYPCVMDGFINTFCPIDFDDPSEGTPEFYVSFYRSTSVEGNSTGLFLSAATTAGDQGLSVIGSAFFSLIYPYVLPFNDNISAGRPWQPLTTYATLYSRYSSTLSASGFYGNWIPTQGTTGGDGTSGAYVGVKFNLDGSGPYYGWIEIYFDGTTAVVKRIGYNTAGDPIPAAVQLSETATTTGLRSVIAAGLAGLSGALLWLQRRFARD